MANIRRAPRRSRPAQYWSQHFLFDLYLNAGLAAARYHIGIASRAARWKSRDRPPSAQEVERVDPRLAGLAAGGDQQRDRNLLKVPPGASRRYIQVLIRDIP